MNQVFELGSKEKLKIICSDEKLEFVNISNSDKNEKFSFSEIIRVKLSKGKTLWIFSTFSWLVELFTNIHIGGRYSEERKLEVNTKNQNLVIWLDKSDLPMAEKVVELIENKMFTFHSK